MRGLHLQTLPHLMVSQRFYSAFDFHSSVYPIFGSSAVFDASTVLLTYSKFLRRIRVTTGRIE